MENMKNTANETVNNLEKKTYDVTVVLESSVENEDEKKFSYTFSEPKPGQFQRYIKEVSKNVVQASKNLVLSNIAQDEREKLIKDMEEYPGMVITIANKFLAMLGFTDNVTFRRK